MVCCEWTIDHSLSLCGVPEHLSGMPRNHDLRDQRIGLTEENLSGGEQDTSEGIPVTPKGKPANGGLRDNTKSAFLIAILIVAFGVLAIAAIAITAAAFSNAPPGSPPHAATTAGANDTADDVEVISRALGDHTDWLIWQINNDGGGVWRARAEETLSSKPLSMADGVIALREGRLGGPLTAALRRSPHARSGSAFFWELPPFTRDTAAQVPFEMVTIAAPGLVGTAADPTPFARHLASCAGLATATFANLGGDAQLVAPCASDGVPMDTYASIAPFVRGAPTSQLEQFWVAVGHALDTTLNARGERCARLPLASTRPSAPRYIPTRIPMVALTPLFACALLAAAVRPGSIRRARASTGCTCASTARPSITTTLPFDDFGRICMRSMCESPCRAIHIPPICECRGISMFGTTMRPPDEFDVGRLCGGDRTLR